MKKSYFLANVTPEVSSKTFSQLGPAVWPVTANITYINIYKYERRALLFRKIYIL